MEPIYKIVRIKQVVREAELSNVDVIRSPEDGADIVHQLIGDDDREVFLVICLSTKNGVIAVHRARVGAVNASIAHPREIFKSAILNNAESIIIAHNHPSSDPSPSPEDIQVTKRMLEAGKIVGIEVLDSLIVDSNSNKHVSLKEKCYIN
ncbi:JAB domain-containing protein [Halobacillus amylolyticus]|uniref:DNA repair protein RadC n=1 Tax=Halobacillus amylolyticus TaxID=2932259 RepID=A0ABY4H8I7_9BACI|nr:JAB domain-containing protein [Halobacillus amylolyticus]UOR11012.1 DNA repair protein RadC [Halobacillus amylolyticus]